MIHFVVEGNPIPQSRPRVTKHGTYDPPHVREWKEAVWYTAKSNCPEPLRGNVRLGLIFCRRDNTPTDLDNLVKAAMDGLRGALYEDDQQVTALFAYKFHAHPRPRLEVVADVDDGTLQGDIELLEELWGKRVL